MATWKSRAEAALSLLSGSVAQPLSGLAGLAGTPWGYERAADNVDAVQNALTYQPRDPRALQGLAQFVAPVTNGLDRLKHGLGDPVLNRTGSPAAATAAYMVPDALLSLLGARAMPKGGPSMSQMARNAAAPRLLHPQTGAIVWHGSPHKFDEFRAMDNIGAGEGHQAYGHGGYLAQERLVADAYRKALSGPSPGYDGKIAPEVMAAFEAEDLLGFETAGEAIKAIREHPDWRQRWTADNPERLQAAFDAHEARKYGGQGHLYKMDIPDEAIGKMLDWDSPLRDQPHVLAALGEYDPNWVRQFMDRPGGELYKAISGGEGIEDMRRAGTKELRGLGIPGIKYRDAGSRGTDSGTRNYVTFDDSLVKILERNGQPVR